MPYEHDTRNSAQRRKDGNAMGDRYGLLESSPPASAASEECLYIIQEVNDRSNADGLCHRINFMVSRMVRLPELVSRGAPNNCNTPRSAHKIT